MKTQLSPEKPRSHPCLPFLGRPPSCSRQIGARALEAGGANVTIIRDDWGIAHVYGKTDADAVFGMVYAQAEDDFNRVETNYINALGRLAEAEGESQNLSGPAHEALHRSRRAEDAVRREPRLAAKLMNAFADGLNFYLYKHPEVKPRVIKHFEPWMALTFTEGSIGGDIERVNLDQLEAFYGKAPTVQAGIDSTPEVQLAYVHDADPPEPTGSNGIAIAPSNTVDHHALLLINPHTSFFFRSELQMVSDEGLNAYGAVTWGQFFVYQGFNERAGWMHTSSGVDAVDEYLETVTKKGDRFFYKYGTEERPSPSKQITVRTRPTTAWPKRNSPSTSRITAPSSASRTASGSASASCRSPSRRSTQSYIRTKAKDYKSFRQTMELKANSSNNTIFADADGDIAYFHGNFIPRRDTSFDWTKPVDGSNPATDWHGLLTVDETPHLLNPKSGWLYNSNNWPWSGAGASSPKQAGLSRLRRDRQRIRARTARHPSPAKQEGFHARLADRRGIRQLSALVREADPALIKAWDDAPARNPLKAKLADQIALLRTWDYRWGVDSVPTSLAVFWGEDIRRHTVDDARKAGISVEEYIGTKAPPSNSSQSLAAASDQTHGRLRNLEDAVGRHQSLPAPQRRHRPTLQRRRAQAFPSASPRRSGARSPRSARAPIPEQRSGTAPAATASSPWSSSATKSAPRPSPPAARAAIPLAALQRRGQALQHRRSARSLLLPPPISKDTPSASTIPEANLPRSMSNSAAPNHDPPTSRASAAATCKSSPRCSPPFSRASCSSLCSAISPSPTGTRASMPRYRARCSPRTRSFPTGTISPGSKSRR